MQIDNDYIVELANQIYLNLTETDLEKLPKELGEIIDETKIMNEVDVSNIKPDVSVLNYSNKFREDEVKVFEENELLLQNAPEISGNMFKIPKIIN